jgi:hypothetical protein
MIRNRRGVSLVGERENDNPEKGIECCYIWDFGVGTESKDWRITGRTSSSLTYLSSPPLYISPPNLPFLRHTVFLEVKENVLLLAEEECPFLPCSLLPTFNT